MVKGRRRRRVSPARTQPDLTSRRVVQLNGKRRGAWPQRKKRSFGKRMKVKMR